MLFGQIAPHCLEYTEYREFAKKGVKMRIKCFIAAMFFMFLGLLTRKDPVTNDELCYFIGSVFVILGAIDDRKK